LQDLRYLMRGTREAGQHVKELVECQRGEIDRFVADEPDPEAAKRTVVFALALVGFHYASQQKLLNGLEAYGLLEQPGQPRPSLFDTISGPSFEGPEPPR
jgi:hypothetical protein